MRIIATNNLSDFHKIYGRLNDLGKNPKWFSRGSVYIIKFDK